MSETDAPMTSEEGPPPAAYRPNRSPFRARPQEPLLKRAVPVSAEIPSYRPHTARRDLLAGLTVAALALPSGMAYAEVAGLSPVNGLYALLLPTVLYTFLGSSRQLIVGPEGSISALVGAAILPPQRRGRAHRRPAREACLERGARVELRHRATSSGRSNLRWSAPSRSCSSTRLPAPISTCSKISAASSSRTYRRLACGLVHSRALARCAQDALWAWEQGDIR